MIANLPIAVTWGLQATPLFLLAGLLALFLRRGSAAQRHFVWTLAVVGALFLPLVALIAPRVAVPLLPAAPVSRVSGTIPLPGAPATRIPAQSAAAVEDPRGREPGSASPVLRSARLDAPPIHVFWGAGAVAFAGLLLVSLATMAIRARRATTITTGTLARELDALCRTLGIRRTVRLIVRDHAMPMTWGIRNPVVLLPAEAEAWSPARRRAVLLHELAHVQRGDWLTQLAARVACVIYWWHPLAWVAARRLRVERELACDDLVLTHGAYPADYAHDLLEIARGMRASPSTALAGVAMARPSQLAGRLLAVLDVSRARRPMSRRWAISGATVGALIIVPVAGLRAVRAAPLEQPSLAGPLLVVETPLAKPLPPESTSLRPTAGPPVQQSRETLCDWSRRGESHSSSTNINDDRATLRIMVDECELYVRTRGKVEFADDERDVARLDSDGFFQIEERRGGERRRVDIDRQGGGLERRWYVNGREQAWQAGAADWLHGALLAMFRRTSFGAEERARRIYSASGKQGLLAESELLLSSSAITTYYTLLLERERLTSTEARRLADLAGERISSSSGLSTVLTKLLQNTGPDEATRASIIRSAGRISSSSGRAEVLVAAAETAPLTPPLAEAVLETAAGISSSSEKGRVLVTVGERLPADRALPAGYVSVASDISSSSEKGRVLVHLIERDRLAPERLVSVLDVARTISSNSELGRVLRTVVGRHRLEAQTRPAFFRAVRQLSSASEQEAVLRAAVQRDPDTATVAEVIDAARVISSSSSRANVLVAVATGGFLSSDELRRAYREAALGISSTSERARVLEAMP
ncbi:MAG TPA: M56 family metallopeptidase [Gemmatimonadales bacterium]